MPNRFWPPRDHFRHRRAVLDLLQNAANRYGDVVGVPFFHRKAVLVSHPNFVGHVLQHNRGNYTRGRASHWLRKFWGEGVVLSDGEAWLQQRRLIGPAFQSKRIDSFACWMLKETQETFRRWDHVAETGKPVDLTKDVWSLTLRILLRTLFGGRDGDSIGEIEPLVNTLLSHSNDQMSGVIPPPYCLLTPRSLIKRFGGRSSLVRLLTEMIQSRCRTREDHGDILSSLVLAKEEGSGASMDTKWILDQVMSLLLAGRESTATSLVWACYLLAKHPDVQDRLRTEVAETLGNQAPAAEDLGRLRYVKAVVEETLRLYPPAYKFTRQAKEADVIGGFDISAGSVIVLSPWVTHRHSHIWSAPETFNPDRFLGSEVNNLPRFSYFPFGAGPRLCAGRSLALMELHLVLALVMQRYRLKMATRSDIIPKAGLTLQPASDVLVTLHRD